MIDLDKIRPVLDEIHACDEKIADRGPIKVLPRPAAEIPNVPALRARILELQSKVRVKRKPGTAKGHDLLADGSAAPNDLTAIGVLEEIRTIKKGQDRALPTSTTIVRVAFPAGEHLWFDPSDLTIVVDSPPKGGKKP